VPPIVVSVSSLGTVNTSVTGTLVPRVIGTKTVALVVGASNVDVMVKALVTSIVFVTVTAGGTR
jgi:hypothetical protein